MREITIRHSRGSYSVRFIGIEQALESLPAGTFIVTDQTLLAIYGHLFPNNVSIYAVEPGEASKSNQCLYEIWRWLAQSGANRRSTVAAVGGGVVGDLAGFAAATFMRGVECVQVATSLMAMVDSSVGGKVGIDIPEGKNLAGSFHPPKRVEVCVDALRTLPERHLRNGIAEVIKYAFIADPTLIEAISGQKEPSWEDVAYRCITIKAGIVEQDEFDANSARAVLNFGHTVGHALEAITDYSALLHGEAVAIGMVAETFLAWSLGMADRSTHDLALSTIQSAGLPVSHEALRSPKLLDFMLADKKRSGAGLAFSIVESPGTCKLVEGVPEATVWSVLQSL